MEAAVEKRWSVTVSDLQAWTYTIMDCQIRYALETLIFSYFSSRVLRSFWRGHMQKQQQQKQKNTTPCLHAL